MENINKIKQSKKGIFYAEPRILDNTKKTVYSQAILQKIPHNTDGKIDIALKLGRYNIVEELETECPKSELTLDNGELNNLIVYIEEYYKPLELNNTGKFITVENETFANILLKLKSLMESNEDIIKMLSDNDVFDDIQTVINAVKKKKTLSEFEKEIDNDKNEAFWQEWFNRNKWILGSEYLKILDERKIDINHIADFLVQVFDGFVDIVEIKKPSLEFWAKQKDNSHNNYVPSSDLIKAITQCQNYLYEIEQEANSVKYVEELKAKIIKPRCLLIIGKSKEWDDEKRKAYRILNSSYTNLTILTYDHLLERAKNIMNKTETLPDFL